MKWIHASVWLWLAMASFAAENIVVLKTRQALQLSNKGEAKVLKPYVKLLAGDQLLLPEAAEVQLVWIDSGRHEIWQGPARLKLLSDAAEESNHKPAAQIKTLPATLRSHLGQVGGTLTSIKQMGGIINVRAVSESDESGAIAEQARKELDADNPSADLFLLQEQWNAQNWSAVYKTLKRLQVLDPKNPELAAVLKHLEQKMAR
ncbi:hypothetical protein ACFQNF_13240 [Iodobacter arcticus]|uniref:Uncharacterized protein n=1 Tax=Iodobacter arcticus TaxID=590593 RepID=A0ABW2QYQ3_9NEIS